MPFEYIVQAIGILGFLLGIAAYLSKDDIALKLLIGIASFAMALHFFFLGAYVGTGAASFSGIRSFLSIFKKVRPLAPLFFAAYIPLGYFYIHGWVDALPIIAGLIGTYAMFYLERLPMRYALFIGTSFWFLHNLLQGSIGGTLLELFYLGANIFTIRKIKKEDAARLTSPLQ
ncbi:MAG: YgjV family protein [Rhodospirillales bacterium]|nr:YgjV family protein [Rhodospirillales bacterium]MCB9964679.1 YgjV family protein [Rhodospirillales bacterium]MCB9979969.1 YgjV family protein [Rhodospirillales bacterium]